MNTPAKVAAFGLGLAAAFAASLGVGAAVGPVDAAPAPAEHAGGGHTDGGATHDPAADPGAGGLTATASGHTLDLLEDVLPAGPATELAFRVLGPDGAPVTAFDVVHDEDLHLVAVRRDLTGYQHVHAVPAADGTWTVPLDLTAGSWRVVVDATPSALGEAVTLGADLSVPGEFAPEELPAPAATAEVDGYTVELTGHLTAGEESELTLSISRDGVPVTDLQPYRGAYGHLVVLRAGDLAYLHVHPTGAATAGPDVVFATTPPAAGVHRLFLDFRHGDVVRTAAFTVTVEAPHG